MKNGHLKIEKGIPMPAGRGKANELTIALQALKVGDSFLYPMAQRTRIGLYAARVKIKVATRTADEKNVRVWRTA